MCSGLGIETLETALLGSRVGALIVPRWVQMLGIGTGGMRIFL